MQQLLSILLVPTKDGENYLSKIIRDLGTRYQAPVFVPHLTLFGGIVMEPEVLKTIVGSVFENIRPFKVKKTKINQSELFFKTVFIEFELSEELQNLFMEVSKRTDNRNLSTFKPHISLLYKTMPEEEKLNIIETLNIKDEFEIGKVVINAPANPEDKDFLNVSGWRSLYEKPLKQTYG